MAKRPIYDFRNYLKMIRVNETKNKIPSLDIKLSTAEITEGKKILHNLVNPNKKTICLFSYGTGAKCYSETWWLELYTRLKLEYSNYNIIEVLPVENISQIGFKEPTFYSREIREIGAVIANSVIFIGADSGIMHLASAVNTPTLGLFSVTNLQMYKPYNTGSQGIDTNKLNTDDIIKEINKIL